MDIDELCWHDGNITRFELLSNYGGEAQINIYAEIYDDPVGSPRRDAVLLKCIGVSRFNCACDLAELNDNSSAGSIADCHFKNNIVRFYLSGGYIEIESSKYVFEK